MKIAITGHTNGIGKALAETFSSHGHTIIGFSLSTKFDISNPTSINEILDFSNDCDMFINNAYDPIGQVELLTSMIKLWDRTEKTIINISSKLSYFPIGKENIYDEYITSKLTQNKIIESRILMGSPKMLNVIVGLVDTRMSNMFINSKMNPKDLANLIYDTVTNPKLHIQQLIVDVPGLDWDDIKRNK